MTVAHLAGAFAVATLVALVATPLARRVAIRTGFLDEPGGHKSHRRSVPYLGGLAIIAATIAGVLAGRAINPTTGRIVLVATLLGAVGLVDDSGPIGARPRLACQLLAAALILGAGIRFQLTGSPITDGFFSLVWIVGITNAFNLLDNMDGLSAGTAALASVGAAAIALAVGQPQLAVVGLALAGASVGFLAFNVRPATIFMGDAGSMFLGAMVASLTLAAHPTGSASARLVVPLLIVGLPVLDTATVTLGRARRRVSVMQGGRDHLSHRLVALGLRPRLAVRTLLLTEAISVALAVLVVRGVVRPWLGLAAGVAVFGVLAVVTIRPRVYDVPVVGLPPVLRWAVAAGALVVVALAGPATVALVRARAPLDAGIAAMQAGISHQQDGDSAAARQDFAAAQVDFAVAWRRLGGVAVRAGEVLPVTAVNLRAARVLAGVGLDANQAGQQLVTSADVASLPLQQGGVPLDALARMAPELQALSVQMDRWSTQVNHLPRTLLVPPIRRAVDNLDARLATAALETRQASDAAGMVPALVGSNGNRRYLVLVQNIAEARASGGLIGSFGELLASHGRVSVGRFAPIGALDAPVGTSRDVPAPADYLARYSRFSPFDLWQNLNLSPDFATVGSVAARLYPTSGGSPVDGVVSVDPVALSAILTLTGPVRVASWPVPISARDVVQVMVPTSATNLSDADRTALLGDVARAAFEALTTRDLGTPLRVSRVLTTAVAQHHLQLFLARTNEEAFTTRLGVSGAFVTTPDDQVLVTTQNASANQVDNYLHRSLNYHLTLDPGPDDPEGPAEVAVNGILDLQLRNDAPVGGGGPSSLGSSVAGLQPGENRTFLSLYTPLAVSSAASDGRPLPLEAGAELGQNVYSSYVDVPPGGTTTIAFTIRGTLSLARGGWYNLDLPHQPTLGADEVSVTVALAPGWQFVAGGGRHFTTAFAADARRDIHLEIKPGGPSGWLAPAARALPPPPP